MREIRRDKPAKHHRWEYYDEEQNISPRSSAYKAICLSCGVKIRVVKMYSDSSKGYYGWSKEGEMKKYREICPVYKMNEALS